MTVGENASETAPEAPRAARKKPPSAGRGRKKGELNHTTRDVRLAVGMIAEKNAHKIDGWLTRIARKDPGRALDLYLRMLEYHIPKLSRQEIVKPDTGPSRILDSSQLTAEQREQLRLMLAQSDPALLEQQPAFHVEQSNGLAGLGDAQVVDSVVDSTEVRAR